MTNTLEDINKEALWKVKVAQPILDKIKSNPELENVHDPVLSRLHDSRWNKHFVLDTLNEVGNIYNVNTYNEVSGNESIPQEVKSFLLDAIKYKFSKFYKS